MHKLKKMKTDEYTQIIKEGNVLDFATLKVTKEQLEKVGNSYLANKIEKIFQKNKIEKPLLHDSLIDNETDYYKIDLETDDIETIVDLFGELEVGALGVNYETTLSASYYANLLDKWNDLPDYR